MTQTNDSQEKAPTEDGTLNGEQPQACSSDISESKIQELEASVKEKESKYVYLYAEFENFKKRAMKERSDLLKFGWEPVARELLLVIDNIERALQHAPAGVDKNFLSGLQLVQQQFLGIVAKQGVQRVEVDKKAFDPNLHEAVGQAPSELPQGTVVHEETPGYTLHGRLLRPARVIVSTGAP